MRPIKLTIEGINSFISEQTVDFEAAGADNIFCISGCTGSGKTTILDSIILALYERHGERGNLVEYINLRSESAKISFVFEMNGDVFESRRVISRKQGKNSTVLLKNGQEFAEGDNAFAYILEKIGLEVKEFTNVVVLQQGEFARFLKSTKSARVNIISKLFDLKRFDNLQSKFNAKTNKLKGEADALDAAIASYEITDEGLKELEAKCADARKRAEEAKKKADELKKRADAVSKAAELFTAQTELKAAVAAAEENLKYFLDKEQKGNEYKKGLIERKADLDRREKERDGLVAALAKIENALKSRSEVDRKFISLKKETQAAEEKRTEADALSKTYAEKEKIRAGLSEKVSEFAAEVLPSADTAGLIKAVSEAKAKAENAEIQLKKAREDEQTAAEKYAEAQAENDRLLVLWKNVNSAHGELLKRESDLKSEAEKSKLEYELAAKNNALASVCVGLKKGDTCPVCGGVITNIERHVAGEITELKNRADRARNEYDEINKRLSESAAQINGIAAKKENAEKTLEERAEEVKAATGERLKFERELSGLKPTQIAELERLVETLEKLEREVKEVKAEADKATAEADITQRELTKRKEELESEKRKLDGELEAAGDADKIRQTLEALNADKEKYNKNVEAADRKMNEIRAEIAGLNGKLNDMRGRVKPCEEVSAEQAGQATADAEQAARDAEQAAKELGGDDTRLERAKKDLDKKKELTAERGRTVKEYDKYFGLATIFKNNAFSEFVAAEYISEFTLVASEKLSKLTGGKYTLGYDEDKGDFYVCDFLSGNVRRGVKTLSGGETFLASLSLAVAISEALSKERDFGFFFIDEGFGTLSPDAIDMVVYALETLARDTMVGIITHRGELIERIPSVIKVEPADGDNGSRIIS